MIKILYFFTILGFLISGYLTYVHYSLTSYFCPTGNNCNKILTSKYSSIFNIPISLFGAIYFISVFFLIYLINSKKKSFKFLNNLLQFLILVGFLTALVLLYIQIFVLKAICFYCFIVDSILLITPIILILEKKLRNKKFLTIINGLIK